MTATEALERRIDELCAENEQLRQQVASIIGRSFRTADKMDCLDTENAKLLKELEAEHALAETLGQHHHEYIQAENAKLRELVRDMWLQLLNAYDRKEVEEFADRIRELEVDE